MTPPVVTITGSGFNSLSSAEVAGSTRATTFVDASHLQFQFSVNDLVSPSSLLISVINPLPGGGTSASLPFTVLSIPGGKFGPGFTAARDATIGGEGCCTTVADFNEDGIPDVATVHFTYDIFNPIPRDEMYVQLGDGHGNLRSRMVLKTGSGPIALVAGDFNHDGHVDLVSANTPITGVSGPSTISVFLGDGMGGFTRNDQTLPFIPVSVTSGDFNNDGKLDLAIGIAPPTSAATTLILLGNGDGTFKKTGATLPSPGGTSAAAGDFNEDGKLDLFTCDIIHDQCYLYFGNGDGTFPAPKILAVALTGPFAVADLDGDGHLDIVAAPSNPSISSIDALWGDGKGNFTVQTISAPWDFDIALGDIDGDGRKDIVLASNGILYQTALRTFTFDGSVSGFGVNPAVSDLNNDGFLDVVGYEQGNVRSYLSQGPHGILHSVITEFPGATAAAVGDFNGDGKLDVAAASSSDVIIMSGDGTGHFSLGTPFGNFLGKIWGIAAGDFTGDGILDLAVGADEIVIYQGDGKGNFTEFSSVPQVTSGSSGVTGTLLVADVNGDGKLDLVVAAVATPEITALLGDGTGHFSIGSQIALGGFSNGIASGDFNEDSHVDLAITDYGFNTNFVRPFLGAGNGKFNAGTPVKGGPAPYSIAAGDFDKDGHLDVVVADFSFNTLLTMPETSLVLFGDGRGNFPRTLTLPTGSQPNSVAVADIDGDGWPDIVLMNNGNFDFDVFINDRNGSFLAPYAFGVGVNPSGFVIGDVDGDGRPDVVSVITNGIEVTLNRTIK